MHANFCSLLQRYHPSTPRFPQSVAPDGVELSRALFVLYKSMAESYEFQE